MPPKSKAAPKNTEIVTNTPNTPAPASSETAADVLETAPVTAGATSTAPTAANGETPKSDAQELSPAAGNAEGAVTAEGAAGGDTLQEYPGIDGSKFSHGIRAVEQRGICRAGQRWTHDETLVNRADWTDEQWAALTGERLLIVREL